MTILCYYDIQRNLWISRLSVEGSNWNKRIPTLYRCLFLPETKNRKSDFMMVLWYFYAIMIFSKICEYLGSRLKVPNEINGFLLSIDASLYQKRKFENLILWWFYAYFMLLWYSAKIVNISALGWSFQLNLSIDASLYQKPKIENLILWWFYDDFMLLWYSAKCVNISALGWSFQLK